MPLVDGWIALKKLAHKLSACTHALDDDERTYNPNIVAMIGPRRLCYSHSRLVGYT